MVIKNYTVTLEQEVVDEVKQIFDLKGQKLSPVINNFLKDIIEKEKDK